MIRENYKVTVVGSGYMGRGIAQTLARGGAFVTLVDQDGLVAEASYKKLIDEVAAAEKSGLVPAGSVEIVQQRSSWKPSIELGVQGADLVMEAVYEDFEVKSRVFAEIEEFALPTAIIGTNTSAIPVASLAKSFKHPGRFFGIHWYNPAPFLPGIEVILSEMSDKELVGPILELLRSAGKDPVIVSDTPGFVANRLQFALFKEAALMVEEGTATPKQIDDVVKSAFGFRLPFFGPFAIADMAGLDVYFNSYKTLESQLGPRFSIPKLLKDRVESGDLGTKTGGGFRGFTGEQVSEMLERRDRSYVALSDLRDRLEGKQEIIAPKVAIDEKG